MMVYVAVVAVMFLPPPVKCRLTGKYNFLEDVVIIRHTNKCLIFFPLVNSMATAHSELRIHAGNSAEIRVALYL